VNWPTKLTTKIEIVEIIHVNTKYKKMKMEKIDSSGKDKAVLLTLPTSDFSYFHWNKRTRIKWTLTFFIGIVLVYSARVAMSICTSAMSKEFSWSKTASGMALSAFFCGYVTTNVVGGYLADRHGGEIVICYTALVWSIITAFLPFIASSGIIGDSTSSVLLLRFLTGVGQGVFFPSFTSILTRHVNVNERGFLYSFAYSGSAVGTILTGFVGSLLIENFDWTLVFYSVGICCLAWALWLRCLVKFYQQGSKDESSDTDDLDSVPYERKSSGLSKMKAKEAVPWMKLVSSPAVWALGVSYYCANMCFYNLLSWTPVYFHDAFPESKGWVFNVIPWLLNFVVANISGYGANLLLVSGHTITFLRKMYAAIHLFGTALFAFLLNYIESYLQALFLMSIIIALQAFGNCSIALNSQDLAPGHAGSLHGIMNCAGAVSGFVGVYITGWMLEVFGSWSLVWNLQAVISFLGCTVFLIWGTGDRVV